MEKEKQEQNQEEPHGGMPGANPKWKELESQPMSGKMQTVVAFPTNFDAVMAFCVLSGRHVGDLLHQTSPIVLDRYINNIKRKVDKGLIPALQRLREKEKYTAENMGIALEALVDSCYWIIGASIALGLPYDVGFAVTHHQNMMKVKDHVGEVGEDGLVAKPADYKPEDWTLLIQRAHRELVTAAMQAANDKKIIVPGAGDLLSH